MNRRELVLAVLACAGGQPYSPVQLQKAVFLITENVGRVIDRGPGFRFEPYDYGPFDSSVYAEADAIQLQGGALIAPSASGRWNTYAASDLGVARGKELLSQIGAGERDYIERVSNWVRAQTFSGLVRSIYEAYPKMKERSIFRG